MRDCTLRKAEHAIDGRNFAWHLHAILLDDRFPRELRHWLVNSPLTLLILFGRLPAAHHLIPKGTRTVDAPVAQADDYAPSEVLTSSLVQDVKQVFHVKLVRPASDAC